MAGDTDTQNLRDALTREVTADAYTIARQIFRTPDGDVARVSNDQLDARYKQAIEGNDRQFLMSEASRDPAQFLASMDRLIQNGHAVMPPGTEIQPDPPLPKDARSNVPIPKAPKSAVQQTYDTPQEVPPPAPVLPQSPGPALGAPPAVMPVPAPPPVAPLVPGGGPILPHPAPVPPPIPPPLIPPPAQPPY